MANEDKIKFAFIEIYFRYSFHPIESVLQTNKNFHSAFINSALDKLTKKRLLRFKICEINSTSKNIK